METRASRSATFSRALSRPYRSPQIENRIRNGDPAIIIHPPRLQTFPAIKLSTEVWNLNRPHALSKNIILARTLSSASASSRKPTPGLLPATTSIAGRLCSLYSKEKIFIWKFIERRWCEDVEYLNSSGSFSSFFLGTTFFKRIVGKTSKKNFTECLCHLFKRSKKVTSFAIFEKDGTLSSLTFILSIRFRRLDDSVDCRNNDSAISILWFFHSLIFPGNFSRIT